MLADIKEIILDFQTLELKTGNPRQLEITHMPGKASVCMGVRRAGKSTYLFQRMQDLLDQGVARESILYLNLFDDRLRGLRDTGLGVVLDAYFALHPEQKSGQIIHCFFDEIQEVPGWEAFIARLLRTEDCRVTLTGSSARMLSKEIATQMRGRSLSWELFPYSFSEFLRAKGIESQGPISSRRRHQITKAFEAYWEEGAFPEVEGLDPHLRTRVHQEYFNAMLFRDLVERHDISHPKSVKDLGIRLVNNLASMHSINKLQGYLKSLGHKAPKASVADYLEWFEDAYVFFTVRIFDSSLARANTNPKKIYCIDHALARSVGSGVLVNTGHLLENLVFMALRRQSPDIHYYKSRSGKEVDFIVLKQDRSRLLVQVCESLADPKTRERELNALEEAMQELDLDQGFVVTRSEEETRETDAGSIRVLPAWRFLLEQEGAE